VKVISRIPFDNVVTEALIAEVPVVEFTDGEISREIEFLWGKILEGLK
jgi:MinD superfamily P-loop ATPase